MSLEAKVLHTYDFSMGFNYNIVPSIDRKQYITELEELLNDNQVVFLKGEEGSGKTIICQEFVKKFDKITFSVFFNPHNKMDYSVNYFLENIINQVGFKLDEIDNDELNIDRYRTLLTKLRKNYKGKKIYFVIDGLSDSVGLLKEIEELLFLGQTEFRYIITGDDAIFKKEIKGLSKINLSTSIKVVGISINDIKYYLNVSEISQREEDDIFKITRGLPSRLFLIKRQLEKNISLSKIMESENYKEWINIELEKIDLSNDTIAKILSLLSLSPNKISLEDISFIMEIDKEQISQILSNIDFVKCEGNNLSFISDSYKISISEKFNNNLDWVENGLIKLLNKTSDLDKKIELIKLLFDRKRWTDIHSEMTDELLINSFRHTGNLNKINSIINIGNNASNQLKLQNNLVHLSIKGSFFNYLQNNLELLSDVTTKLAFKDYDGALNIANKSVINVERLKLYCLIAKKQKLDNNIIEEILLSDIEDLFENSDFSNSGDDIYDIVSDLLYIDPSMALKILDNKEIDSSNINDLIVAKLSMMSLNNEVDNDKKESANEKLEKFNNIKSRKIARALGYILSNFSLDKILNEIDKIDDSIEKIKLTRLYLENIKTATEGLEKLIDKTFDILLSSNVNNLINLEILILLSSKILLVKSIDDKKNLLKKLNSIDQLIIDKGLFINKIRYKINIFNIKLSEAPDKSFEILDEIISEIETEEDLLIKAESLSLVYKSLFKCNSPILKNLRSKNYNILNITVDSLIQCTANQKLVFTNVIKNISSVDLHFAVDISKRLNNSVSRDFCLLTGIENSIDNVDVKFINIENLISHLNLFNEIYFKSWAVSLIFEKFAEEDSLKNHFLIKIKEIYFSIEKELNSDSSLVYLNILLFKIFKKNIQTNRKDFTATKDRLKVLINAFSQDWTRYEIVNTICAELAEFDIHFTTEIYSQIKNIKDSDVFYSELYCKSYHYNLEYLIFSLESLIEKKVNIEQYIDNIIIAINKIPSDLARLDYFSKLGFIFHLHNHNDLSCKFRLY
ncbi:NB-ARC domain-containing protein [Flavobacterium flavigenum]|uniref:NB-ARC domain-containing protein n=1 Tax=Flavobacterium flavigenum TaxID=3003258 RepID=UPI002482261A|nr:NB-ARC domain-containing protein [Flavobacterium flavigenum]